MNFKIRCKTAGTAALAQSIAVKKGAQWASGHREVLYKEPLYIYCRRGIMTRSSCNEDYFSSMKYPEVDIIELSRL